jgi:hypothetical protein
MSVKGRMVFRDFDQAMQNAAGVHSGQFIGLQVTIGQML